MKVTERFLRDAQTQLAFCENTAASSAFVYSRVYRVAALRIAETVLISLIACMIPNAVINITVESTLAHAWMKLMVSGYEMPITEQTICKLSDAVDFIEQYRNNYELITEDSLSYLTILGKDIIEELRSLNESASIA